MNLSFCPSPSEPPRPVDFAPTTTTGSTGRAAPPSEGFARLVDRAAAEPKPRPANAEGPSLPEGGGDAPSPTSSHTDTAAGHRSHRDGDEGVTATALEAASQCCVVPLPPLPPLPPVLVPVPLLETGSGDAPAAQPVTAPGEGGQLICSAEFFTHADAPATEPPTAAIAAPEPGARLSQPQRPLVPTSPPISQRWPTPVPAAAGTAALQLIKQGEPELAGVRVFPDLEPSVAPEQTPSSRRLAVAFAGPQEMETHRGMAAAEHGRQMKQLTNQDEIADLLLQDLPDPAAWSVAVRAPERTRGQRLAEGWLPEAGFAAWDLTGMERRATGNETATVADTSTSVVHRLLPLVTEEVRMLKQAGPGELSVLLKPDAHTEIVLHLRTVAGHVEATVRCEHGDFSRLNSEWGQLREALAPQGVQLLPLTEPGGTTPFRPELPSGSGPSANGEQAHRQPPRVPESLDELPLTGSITESPRSPRKAGGSSRRLLESWA